jgi:hypothetical protein
VEPTPTWPDIKQLIVRSKPPLSCTVAEVDGTGEARRARVVFDGAHGWWIDDGTRGELRLSDERAVFVEQERVELVAGSSFVYANGWVKSAIEGRLLASLDEARGDVRGTETVLGRNCWICEVAGLKHGDDVSFRLAVDSKTGIIVRMQRSDGAGSLEVRNLLFGPDA